MNEYLSINNKELNHKLLNHLFVKLNSNHFVPISDLKISNESNSLFVEFYEKNKEKQDFFFLKKTDLSSFLINNQQLIKESKSADMAIKVLDQCLGFAFENIVEEKFTPASINLGISLIYSTTNERSPEFLSTLFNILLSDGSIAKTTFARSLICYGIMKSKSYQSPKNYNDVITASLLCDVGNITNPNDSHPQNSCQILRDHGVKDHIIEIVKHHHENNNASGPLRLDTTKIHPLSKILRLSDEIANLKLPTLIALKKILLTKENLVDKDLAETFLSGLLKFKN